MALRKPTVNAEPQVEVQAEAAPVAEAKAAATTQPEAEAVQGVLVEDEQQADVQVLDAEAGLSAEEAEVVEQLAAEPVEQDEPKEPSKPATDLVMQQTTTAVAAAPTERQRGAMSGYVSNELAAQGFEDLELTGFSFDRIKLHEGKFKLGTEEFDLGEEFDCIIHSTRAIYVVRQSTDEDAEVYYSYDPKGLTLSDGTPADDLLAEWRDEGYATEDNPVDVKKYLEVMVTLTNRDDEYNDSMASLSVPPASRDRLAGAAAMAKQKFGCSPDGVITRCKVGKKTGEGKKAFRPWVFQAVSKIG